jgi:hypothetical protein
VSAESVQQYDSCWPATFDGCLKARRGSERLPMQRAQLAAATPASARPLVNLLIMSVG